MADVAAVRMAVVKRQLAEQRRHARGDIGEHAEGHDGGQAECACSWGGR